MVRVVKWTTTVKIKVRQRPYRGLLIKGSALQLKEAKYQVSMMVHHELTEFERLFGMMPFTSFHRDRGDNPKRVA